MLWYALLGVIAVQRLAELALAARNTRRLIAQGGVEHGARHYPLFVVLHTAWLAALILLVPGDAPLDPYWFALLAVLMAGRVWVVATLGKYWTTRVITVPGAPLVRRGPYRWLRHPNYIVVTGEIAVVPLIAGAWPIALVFSAANALLLWWRLRVEAAALADRRIPPAPHRSAG